MGEEMDMLQVGDPDSQHRPYSADASVRSKPPSDKKLHTEISSSLSKQSTSDDTSGYTSGHNRESGDLNQDAHWKAGAGKGLKLSCPQSKDKKQNTPGKCGLAPGTGGFKASLLQVGQGAAEEELTEYQELFMEAVDYALLAGSCGAYQSVCETGNGAADKTVDFLLSRASVWVKVFGKVFKNIGEYMKRTSLARDSKKKIKMIFSPDPAVKKKGRCMDKVTKKFSKAGHYGTRELTDLVRGYFVFDTPSDVEEFVTLLNSELEEDTNNIGVLPTRMFVGAAYDRVKEKRVPKTVKVELVSGRNRFQQVCGDALLLFRISDTNAAPHGHIVEVQLHVKDVLEKKNGVAHVFYDLLRVIQEGDGSEGYATEHTEGKFISTKTDKQCKKIFKEIGKFIDAILKNALALEYLGKMKKKNGAVKAFTNFQKKPNKKDLGDIATYIMEGQKQALDDGKKAAEKKGGSLSAIPATFNTAPDPSWCGVNAAKDECPPMDSLEVCVNDGKDAMIA